MPCAVLLYIILQKAPTKGVAEVPPTPLQVNQDAKESKSVETPYKRNPPVYNIAGVEEVNTNPGEKVEKMW